MYQTLSIAGLPKWAHERIEELYRDDDGYWVLLKPEWKIDGSGNWREGSKRRLLEVVRKEAKRIDT